jgi:hypothetical protein
VNRVAGLGKPRDVATGAERLAGAAKGNDAHIVPGIDQ